MAVVAALVYLSRPIAPANRPIGWGVTFDEDFAGKLGLNWAEAYLAILDDLKIRHVRLSAYWSEIEKSEGIFDFNDLDWQVQQASQRQAKLFWPSAANCLAGRNVTNPRGWPGRPSWRRNNNCWSILARSSIIIKIIRRLPPGRWKTSHFCLSANVRRGILRYWIRKSRWLKN